MTNELHRLKPENLLSLEPEEIAQLLLPMLKNRTNQEDGEIMWHVFMADLKSFYESHGVVGNQKFMRVMMEGWNWMVTHGLIAISPQHQTQPVEFLTRAAWRLKTTQDFESFRKASLLSPKLLHPVIEEKAWPTFIRGKYDTAVFEAFKEVEVAVRTAGGYDPRMIGIDLMWMAFNADNGKLTDKNLPKGERDALPALFAGAIGSYKNPTSHRAVVIDATEAGEMLILASHLLRIVDARGAMLQQEVP